ncbi:hypothetical protein [Agromyces mangrovi Wang et al. 2018]|uniref:hypothetical protein n=1 Tax=Agromyces mangrovi TaxID=1858653 RepID=UPI0025746903|nr:hypothetical protein [Agromyces mangrovi]
MAVHGSGSRMPWGDVPASLRAAVDDLLGSPVVDAVSQPAGFSPAPPTGSRRPTVRARS